TTGGCATRSCRVNRCRRRSRQGGRVSNGVGSRFERAASRRCPFKTTPDPVSEDTMRINRRGFVKLGAAGLASGLMGRRALQAVAPADVAPRFELVQPDLFAVAGAQPNCWADFNNDGSLDLFVGFKD